MLLSIIVPVYNVEKYLNRCVDSLLDQGDFKDYEIILVDDGSTDKSADMCDMLAANNALVKALHKPNGGLSSARNYGVKAANGDYIMFVDSDDYIKSFILSQLTHTILKHKLDILVFNFSYIYGKYNVVKNDVFLADYTDVVTGSEYMTDNLKAGTMNMVVWNKIYKKSLIIDNGIFFRDGYVHEDEEWTPRVLYAANLVKSVDEVVYGYVIRQNSISNANNEKSAKDLISNCECLKSFAASIEQPKLRNLYEDYLVTLTLSAFYKGKLVDYKDKIIEIISGLHASNYNKKKISLFSKSPKKYLLINTANKYLSSKISIIKRSLQFFSKCVDYAMQKIHKYSRKLFICNSQKKKLDNHSFSIIASTCNGGVITSELGEQFRSPTINIWFEPQDYLKLIKNLRYYMSLEVSEVINSFYPYPVGRIDDVTIYFMHYHTFEEAEQKWTARKKRINYDDIFYMMAEKDGCTPEQVYEFDSLPYKNKVIFTYNEYPDCKSAVCVRGCSENGEAAIMTDYVGLYNRKYDRYFDYVKWLNEGERA